MVLLQAERVETNAKSAMIAMAEALCERAEKMNILPRRYQNGIV
jgi:hypothetical protein